MSDHCTVAGPAGLRRPAPSGKIQPMETVTLSSKYQLVLPRGARERLGLRPGMKLTVLDKGRVIFLVPERPMRAYRGLAQGTRVRLVREKKDRL